MVNGKWYAFFKYTTDQIVLPKTNRSVGLDRGVNVFVATSDSELLDNPKFGKKADFKLKRLSRKASKRVKNSNRRKKAWKQVAKVHDGIKKCRRNHAHLVAKSIVELYDTIFIEDLQLKNMTKSAKGTIEEPGKNVSQKRGLNRSILDAGLGQLGVLIREKAWRANKEVILVNAAYTSQTCFACKHVAKKNRKGINFCCVKCGYHDHADINAAKNILYEGELKLARKLPLGSGQGLIYQTDDRIDPRSCLNNFVRNEIASSR